VAANQEKFQLREISVKNLAYIIQARVEEIFEHVYYEIKCSGFEKKLLAGIVVTGGGAQLKHIAQLVEYVTGMDTRVGYPNEHLSKGMVEEMKSPMFATGIGLVLKGFGKETKSSKEPVAQASNNVTARSKGGLFKSIFQKSKKWLEDEDIEEFKES
jgi:cell division protein FtsA